MVIWYLFLFFNLRFLCHFSNLQHCLYWFEFLFRNSSAQNDQNAKGLKENVLSTLKFEQRYGLSKKLEILRLLLNIQKEPPLWLHNYIDTFYYKTTSHINKHVSFLKREREKEKWKRSAGTENIHILHCLCHTFKGLFHLPLMESFNWLKVN